MDTVAMWIGYAVMISGGVGLALAALWLAADAAFRVWYSALNMGDVADALKEWRENHPEKLRRWKNRNGAEGT